MSPIFRSTFGCILFFCTLILITSETAVAQTNTCKPSVCTPSEVLFTNGLLERGTSPNITGCIAYVNASEDNLLGDTVESVSLIQPLRDIPIIGSVINKINPIIAGEKYAAEVVAVIDGDKTFMDLAWTIFVDIATQQLGAKLSGTTLEFMGKSLTIENAQYDFLIGPVLKEIAKRMKENATEWVKFHNASQSWSYISLQHCIDTGKLACYPNYRGFLQEYPETFKYLDRVQVLSCGITQSSDAVVSATALNVRAGPGISHTAIGTVRRGDNLDVVGRNRDCSWLRIVTPTKVQGWVSAQYVNLTLACGRIPEISPPALSSQPPVANSPTQVTPIASDGIELCDGVNYGGPCQLFTEGKYSTLANYGWQDRAESVRFLGSYRGNYHVVLLTESNFGGNPYHADDNVPNLGESHRNRIRSLEIYRKQPPAPQPEAVIAFNADRTILTAGECTILRWDVENVREVYLDGQGVAGRDSRQVCPVATQPFHLGIVHKDGRHDERVVTIQVSGIGGEVCGQFTWFQLGIDKYPVFQVHNSAELWFFDEVRLGKMPEAGSYGKIFNPRFVNEEFSPGIKWLMEASNIAIVSGCIKDAQSSDKTTLYVARPPVDVYVDAGGGWQNAGLSVRAGESVVITYISGQWSGCAIYGCPFVGPEGWTSPDRWKTPEESRNYADNLILGCPHAALLARFSNSQPFCVEHNMTVQAPVGGDLQFRINDSNIGDNDGSLHLQVQVP